MPASPGAQTPAGGSGNSNDAHGKAPNTMGAPNWPPVQGPDAIKTTQRQTGSNTQGPK